jgi:DNA-binding XRE family transcriptional regulator
MNELLDAAKAKLDCATDSELAQALGVGPSRSCNYRKGRTLPNIWMARRIARALRLSPAAVVTLIRRERELR